MKKLLFKILSLFAAGIIAINVISLNTYAEKYTDYDGKTVELINPDDSWDKFEITSEDDLYKLSELCRLDASSKMLYVELKNDITLSGKDYTPIPYFNGIFNGNGNTISGLTCCVSNEPVGLIAVIGTTGVVKNLHIEGNLQPEETVSHIGAIAGENRGTIFNCSFSGVVTGDNYVGGLVGDNTLTGKIINSSSRGAVRGSDMTGGIVGINNGTVILCTNDALINTESVEAAYDITSIDMSLMLDFTKLATQNSTTAKDMGGIAGYSSGMITGCVNNGEVGYAHQGYNAGGIVGRSCGYIFECRNNALVTGRKDIGGIVGQMEPYVLETVTESSLYTLSVQLEELQALMEKTQQDADKAGTTLSNRFDRINSNLSKAESNASDLSKSIIDERGSIKDNIPENAKESAEDIYNNIKDGNIKDTVENQEGNRSEEIEKNQEALHNSLKEMNTQLELLNKEARGASKDLDNDLTEINKKYDEIQETIEVISNMDFRVKDTSIVDADLITLGAVRRCENEGKVEGDLNAGGIVGVMGEESSVDPEDEISLSIDTTKHKEYEYKAVLDSCVNRGYVYTKRSYAGGIVARAEIGYIRNAENYGDIHSDGSYVGGIAASSGITIKDCYAKSILSGTKYVGGITGEGINENANGEGSVVSGCRSLVTISDAQRFFGAISGTPDGRYDNNIFVGDDLMGLGVYSKADCAYPVSYEELIAGKEVPEEFKKLYLSFVSDEEIVLKSEVNYGDRISFERFPGIPAKRGYYAKWDSEGIESVSSDVTVTAVYEPYISSLASKELRASERAVFYTEGDFSENDELIVKAGEFEFAPEKENGNWLLNFLYERKVEEKWKVSISEDGRGTHIVRYLPTGVSLKTPEIYINDTGAFHKAELTEYGMYYSFEAASTEFDIAIVSTEAVYYSFAILISVCVATVAVLVILIILISRGVKRKAKRSAKKEELSEESTEEISKNDEELPIRKKKGSKLLRVAFGTVNIALFIAMVLGTIYLSKHPEIVGAKITYYLSMKAASDTSSQCNVELNIKNGDKTTLLETFVFNCEEDGIKITGIETEGLCLYKSGSKVYLKNGYGFEVTDIIPSYEAVLSTLVPTLKDSTITSGKIDGGTKYTVIPNRDGAQKIIEQILGEYSTGMEDLENVTVNILAGSGKIKTVEIKGSIILASGEKVLVDCNMTLIPTEERREISVPKEVIASIKADNPVIPIDPGMLKLLSAVGGFTTAEANTCDVRVTASGGIGSVSDSFSWKRSKVEDEYISVVTKNGISIYYNEQGACTEKGVSLSSQQAELKDTAAVLDSVYAICLKTPPKEEKTDKGVCYSVSLDEDDLDSIATALVPKLAELDAKLNSGNVEIYVSEEGVLSKIEFKLAGSAKLALAERNFNIKLSAVLVHSNAGVDYKIPTEVINTLAGN